MNKSFQAWRIPSPYLAVIDLARYVANIISTEKILRSVSLYLRSLRPEQWTKNLIVFAAPLFSVRLNLLSLAGSLLAFASFCCISSSFYLFNDVADLASDRQHPIKRYRPIATGLIPVPIAITIAVSLLLFSLLIGWLHSPSLAYVLLAYGVLQTAYNLKLKHLPILDLFAIATGFILRAWAGAVATNVTLSAWFLLCTAMLALFLGIEKRKAELRFFSSSDRKTRSVLQYYSKSLLTRMESTVTTATVMSYSLWSAGPLLNGATTSWMLVTLPFVMYGIFRYQLLGDPEAAAAHKDAAYPQAKGGQYKERTERPEEIFLTDLPLQIIVVGWVLIVIAILLLKKHGLIV
ncbi:decaprenyl-phosphate phosphoribosyltransferase [Acaryochloris sp. IP29b_bin.148]|uniref:decaprenyl-phosphate phosphoribosyltransferase n=1 Tax=Acaryochloris sp. IP29b_bin.148 TaxID=2969218 RepID=UPI00260AF861|nr:decaprenyl-phosphate phosphoribosyltransferase [Acaryochloris sp. IP29b_bin.148]